MDSFIISQSEAILIGRCLELYLQELKDDATVRFTDHIEDDIRCFIPPAPDPTTFKREPTIPDSVEWIVLGDDRIGYTSEHPQSVYICQDYSEALADCDYSDCRLYWEVERIEVAKTIDSLIIELLHDLLDPSIAAVRESLPPLKWGLAEFEHERRQSSENSESPSTFDESSEEIKRRLADLVQAKDNQQKAAFKMGRILGALEANYRRGVADAVYWMKRAFELVTDGPDDRVDLLANLKYATYSGNSTNHKGRWAPLSPVEWHLRSEPLVALLVKQDDVLLSGLSRRIIELDQDYHESWHDFGGEPDDSREQEFLPNLLSAERYLHRLHFVLGELIGRSHVADDETRQVNSARPVPREFRLSPTSTADRIRGSLELAEKWLTSDDAHNALGPTIVASLGPSVEALARRNWPDDFTGRRPDLSRILHEHLRNGSDLEQKFASTGMYLYKSYRNPTSHDFDSVSCSPLEALSFFNSVRVLLQLSDTICASRRKDS